MKKTNAAAVLKGELLQIEQADGPAVILVGSQRWFDWLRQADRFVVRWYRYHTLFAEVLRAELRQMVRRLSSGQRSDGLPRSSSG